MSEGARADAGRFAGRVAVVIGGGRGIGRAAALRLTREGATVHVADAAAPFAEEVFDEIRAIGGEGSAAVVDAADAASVGRYFYGVGEDAGRIDVLVNCPAHASDTHFEQVTESEWDSDVAATLKAPFLCIQAALPYLLRSDGAAVVSIGSVNGIQAFGNEAYGAAKAGVINLHQNLAVRYGPQGVRFNVVAPGTVRTRSWELRLAAEPGVLDEVARLYLLRRVAVPDDIAAAITFLASSDASWITGTVLAVDGGITAGHGEFMASTFGEQFFTTTAGERPRA